MRRFFSSYTHYPWTKYRRWDYIYGKGDYIYEKVAKIYCKKSQKDTTVGNRFIIGHKTVRDMLFRADHALLSFDRERDTIHSLISDPFAFNQTGKNYIVCVWSMSSNWRMLSANPKFGIYYYWVSQNLTQICTVSTYV